MKSDNGKLQPMTAVFGCDHPA